MSIFTKTVSPRTVENILNQFTEMKKELLTVITNAKDAAELKSAYIDALKTEIDVLNNEQMRAARVIGKIDELTE